MTSGISRKAHKRLSLDLKLSRCFMRIFLSLFTGDLKKICDEPFGVDSKCNFRSIAMFASIIKECFVDDDFLTGKSRICFLIFFVEFLVLMFTDMPFLCKVMSMLVLSYHVHK